VRIEETLSSLHFVFGVGDKFTGLFSRTEVNVSPAQQLLVLRSANEVSHQLFNIIREVISLKCDLTSASIRARLVGTADQYGVSRQFDLACELAFSCPLYVERLLRGDALVLLAFWILLSNLLMISCLKLLPLMNLMS